MNCCRDDCNAALRGHLDCLKYIHEGGESHNRCPLSEDVSYWAAHNGHLDCLKYIHEVNENGYLWHEDVTYIAAKYGHLDCLKYIHEESESHNRCHWDESATYWAACNGQLDCLKYLYENGCPWDKRATYAAASDGRLSILKYIFEVVRYERDDTWDERFDDEVEVSKFPGDIQDFLKEVGAEWKSGAIGANIKGSG